MKKFIMNSHNSLASLSKGILPFSDKPFVNLTGIQLPGISSETQKVTMELLQKNHDKFDILFNRIGFHNHFVHHVLAAYSLGGSEHILNQIYEKNASYQRPRAPPKLTITRENWTEHLGKNELWSDFLEFFDKIIKEEGIEKVFNSYAFHPQIFPRLFDGVFHPIIHLGYGIEFQIPIIVSEGLAQAAIHGNEFDDVINENYLSFKGTEKKKSIMEIIQDVSKDERFDIIVHSVQQLLTKRADVVTDYAKQWFIPETEEAVREATRELYDACALAYGATGIRPDKAKIDLDFFLMHGLTSVLLISVMLPYVSLDKRIMLLRAHFAGVLSEYIVRGRPKFHTDLVKNYRPKKVSSEPNPWHDIVKKSLLEDEDAHFIKVMRSLLKAEHEWTPNEKENIYVKIAQLTCDGFTDYNWRY